MLENLHGKPESYRKKLAFATTSFLFLAIFASWVSYKGLLSSNPQLAENLKSMNTATVVLSNEPVQNTQLKKNQADSDSAWQILKKQFGMVKESISSVFTPFMSNIETYDYSSK
jgi:hypothetical protein